MAAQQPYPQYVCQQENPLTCHAATSESGECSICHFPAILEAKTKINGQHPYEIVAFRGQRGNGRLYEAVNLTDQSPCVVKEYLLPRQTFSPQQVSECREAFIQRSGISLADGRVQNFRLVMPVDAIAPPRSSSTSERYFLVYANESPTTTSLKQYLEQQTPLPITTTRIILSQILQSLEFMHQQQFRWISGQLQSGILHGNLNLDSVLVADQDPGLLVYVCDFHFWEHLFNSPSHPPSHPTIAQDLQAVGDIAIYLSTTHKEDLASLEIIPLENWVKSDLPTADKNFINRLMGKSAPPFETAEQARQELLQLPPISKSDLPPPQITDQTPSPSRQVQFRWWMGLAIAYILLGGVALGWWWYKSQSKPAVANDNIPCCIDQIANVPAGPVLFAAAKQGTWDYLFTQPHLLVRNKTLQQELEKAQVLLQAWEYQPMPISQDGITGEQSKAYGPQVISLLREETTDFIIANHTDDIDPSFGVKPFAYNGIAVFVAFGYDQRQNSLPRSLHGKITLKQLRELYTGRITNWQQIGGPDRPVKLYFPSQDGLLHIFERKVLVDQPSIVAFRRLMSAQGSQPISQPGQQCSGSPCGFASTTLQLRAVIEDYEDRNSFSIGFDELNKVINQCAVYPLALVAKGRAAISPFMLDNRQPITPATDLCNSKASYSINYRALQTQTYPLTFSLNVVHARDNRRQPAGQAFANILRTQETQCWLKQIGLAPYHAMPSRSACKAKSQKKS